MRGNYPARANWCNEKNLTLRCARARAFVRNVEKPQLAIHSCVREGIVFATYNPSKIAAHFREYERRLGDATKEKQWKATCGGEKRTSVEKKT